MGRWQFHYRIADCAIVLQGTDSRLEALAASLYEGARCEQAGLQIHACFDLDVHAGSFMLKCAEGEIVAADSLNKFFQLVEWQLTETFMRGLKSFYQLHAAVAVCKGRALILCGPSEAGKTSLLIGWAASGALAYTDEIALIAEGDLQVLPFPRDLIVHQGTQRLFPEWVADLPTWKDFDAYRFVSPIVFGGHSSQAPVPCRALLFPVRKSGAGAVLHPLGQAEAASRLLQQSFSLWDWGEAAVEMVGRLVESCPANEIVFADAREAAALLLDSEV